jgi:hypothetical protein
MIPPMTKANRKTDQIGVRITPEERTALERAAAADDRSISWLCRKVIVDWLREHGHLAADQPGQS